MSHHLEAFKNDVIKRSDSHVNRFLKLKAAPDLLALGIYPNIKEVTESMACVEATFRHLKHLDRAAENVRVLVVGDGHGPRTGALFAFMTKWQVTSVDPEMRPRSDVRRLTCVRAKVEEMAPQPWDVIVLPHAHVTVPQACRAHGSEKPVSVVSLQCCVKHRVDGYEPDVEYDDEGCKSMQRRIRIWKAL